MVHRERRGNLCLFLVNAFFVWRVATLGNEIMCSLLEITVIVIIDFGGVTSSFGVLFI